MTVHVRERPPLRVSMEAQAPSGRCWRWARDEPLAANIPGGLRWSDTMPGGFETLDVTLPREPGVDYSDLERLSTLTVLGAGGHDVAGEYRLERSPRVSGEKMAVSPGAVGWQANLDDDKTVRGIIVDRDAGHWQEPTVARRLAQLTAGEDQGHYRASSGGGGLSFDGPSGAAIPNLASGALMYVAPTGLRIGRVGYRGTEQNTGSVEAATLFVDGAEAIDSPQSFPLTLDDTTRSVDVTTPERYLLLRAIATGGHTPPAGSPFGRTLTQIAVYGDHGLTLYPIDGEPDGVLASDVVAYAVTRGAPLLQITDESIQRSSFVIPHLAFLDLTTTSEIIRQATRYGLQDWAVWEDRVFWWHARGGRGRSWRARISPAQLEETGPQLDRLWESVIVAYQDVDGTTRTVGPAGSGADTETDALKDTDPDNPANQLGIRRRDLLTMGVSTAAAATEVGRRFLEEQKLLDTSGRARIVGHVEDDRGILHPYHRVRAGDTIVFVDAADPSPRRIVRSEKNADTHTCNIDLDAPPEGLAALLERLGVVLVPLGR